MPSHLCMPGRSCAECRTYDRYQRESKDDEARDILDERSARKGFGGRWPCHIAMCYDGESRDSVLHSPEVLTLVHVARTRERYRVVGLKPVGGTDRAPVCGPCLGKLRAHTMWDDDADGWERVN